MRRLSLSLAPLLFALPAPAADWPVPRGPSREPVPYQHDAARQKAVPKEFLDDAPACILYNGTTHSLEADGTIETITHDLIRFNGRKGIEKLGEHRDIVYDPSFQKVTLNEARILKADGRRIPLRPEDAHLRDEGTDYSSYRERKELVLSFPGLEVGDAIEVKWTVRGKNPEHQGHFFRRHTFGYENYPTVLEDLRMILPAGRTLKYAAIGGGIDPKVSEKDGKRTYHWQVTNRRQFPRDDDRPSKEEFRLQVALSTLASWQEVDKWNRQAHANCWECTADVKKVVQDVTKGCKTPLEKARALTYWVRRRVRYLSNGARHGYMPHTPARTLADRYGDCKDKSQLLAVLLREAGVPASLASLGTLDDGQILESVPSPWASHMIVRVRIEGKDHWIDPTTTRAAWDDLPFDDRDRLCYVLDAAAMAQGKDSLRLLRTPRLRPEDNRIEQTTRLVISPNGTSRGQRTVVYHGSAALKARNDWLDTPAGERRRLVARELQNAFSAARLLKLEIDENGLRDYDRPVTAKMEFEVPEHFSGSEPRGSFADNKLWGLLLSPNIDYDRQTPLDLYKPFEIKHHYVIELPACYRFDGEPTDQDFKSKWGRFIRVARIAPMNPRRLTVDFHTRLENPRVERPDFAAFRKFQDDILGYYRVYRTLKPVRDLADAPAVEAALSKTPADRDSALILAKLYHDKGKFEDARRVLRRALERHPKDEQLLRWTLMVAEGMEGQAAQDRGTAHLRLARLAFDRSNYVEARQQLDKAVKAWPELVASASAAVFEARLCEKLNRPEEALAAYRKALKEKPNDFAALAGCVRLHLAAGDRPEALTALRRCTLAAGKDTDRLAEVAEMYLRLARWDDAAELAEQSLKVKANDVAQRVLGQVYAHRGEHDRAVSHLEPTAADAPSLEALIRSHLALGRLADAERAAARREKVGKPTASLVEACLEVNNLAQRRAALLKVSRLPAEKAAVIDRFLCAEHARGKGRPAAQVESLLQGAFGQGVEFGQAFGLRALLALERGRLTQALADADRCVALSPQEARGHYVRGRVRLERAADGALADLGRAAELSGRKDGAVLHWLGLAYFQAGRFREAVEAQRAAAKIEPGNKEYADQLRRFEEHVTSEPRP